MSRRLRHLIFLLFLMLTAAHLAAAQETVSLTSGGSPTVSGHLPTTPVSTESPIGSELVANLNFGDVAPASDGVRKIKITIPIRISATQNYKVELQRASANGLEISPSDIGFGVTNVRPQIAGSKLLATNAASGVTIAGKFGSNPMSAPVIQGIPQFQSTLADVGTNPTIIFTGVPTIEKGSFDDNGNSILVDLTFVIVAQYFAAEDVANLNLAISITPM